MAQLTLDQREIDFLLYEFLDTQQLLSRERYQEHSREIFDATLNTAQTIAERYFADHNAKGDANEPHFDGGVAHVIPEAKLAWQKFAEAGFLAAHYDFELGGMQLPEVVLRAAMSHFSAANISSTAYPFLTLGAANLVHTFASEEHKEKFLPLMMDGRSSGTMALTEPNQGSALADIKTVAKPADDGSYRLFGQKMFISGGDQNITDNIIHMVLAKIEGAPAGTKGISLFICPKFLLNEDGTPGERNDVALAGLLHKMGYRNTTSTVLNFGEKDGAVGYLVGEPHKGLSYMFQMMNEARIGVGSGAAILAYQGYRLSLEYARERPQGRKPSNRDSSSKQVNIVEHADVRRLLLAQKAYSEGSLAMCFYASSLFEDTQTANTQQERDAAALILDLITPVVKSWPSKYGVMANDMAIQVLGGAGYTREYMAEQYFRDNRLNPIHEGTEAIHGIDILGRKIAQQGGAGFSALCQMMMDTAAQAKTDPASSDMAESLIQAVNTLTETTANLHKQQGGNVDLALANATLYLDMFGRVFAAWIWLKQAMVAQQSLAEAKSADEGYYKGKIHTAKYYIQWELPQINAQADLLCGANPIPFDMQDNWF